MADKIVEQDDPGRYGYGTTPAVDTLFKRIREKKIRSACLIAINIETLVRNTAESNLKVKEVVDRVCEYMSNIVNDFSAIVSDWDVGQHHVVFYYCALTCVPNLFRRHHEGTTALLAKEALAAVIDRIKDSKEQTHGNVTSHICLGTDLKQPSYKGLVNIFNKITSRDVPVHMISHCPVDYHIGRLGRIGVMYRSYTGVAVDMTPRALGEIVFGVKTVPFYPITHVMLGDKSFIKGLAFKKDREMFLEIAAREKFLLRSETYIRSNAKINSQIIPYKLD